MRFSVVIPTVRPTTLGAAIRSVIGQSFGDWELIVVGQGDAEPLRTAVDEAALGDDRIRYVHLDRRGLSIARNAGIAAAAGEIVALMDDDCEARPDWLEVLDTEFADPEVGLVGGSLIAPPREHRLGSCPELAAAELRYDPVAADRVAPPELGLVGGNLALRRSVCAAVGAFDEQLGAGTDFGAAEETDYLLRLEALGTTIVTTPRSMIDHTFGYRYGWRAIYDHKRNYARGNGALGAKLTLLGDRRGDEWMQANIGEVRARLAPRRWPSLPNAVLRLWHYRRGAAACCREFVVEPAGDPVTAVLRPRR